MRKCLETPFQFRCIYVDPNDVLEPYFTQLFDTYLSAQGMEGIFELRPCLSPLLMQYGPSRVLVHHSFQQGNIVP
jgi:hypothetical protein